MSFRRFMLCVLMGLIVLPLSAEAETRKVAWSIYPGWMPIPHAEFKGYIREEASKRGLTIEIVELSYPASFEQFTNGAFDACVMTNMEAYDFPAASGVDVTVLSITDYSNGNDAVLVKEGVNPRTLPRGSQVLLQEGTVSHYLYNKWVESIGRTPDYFQLVNITNEALFVATFSQGDYPVGITWNPHKMNLQNEPAVNPVPAYSSADIPGHIMDLLIATTASVKESPQFAEALTVAVYRSMADMANRKTKWQTLQWMADKSGAGDRQEFNGQLETTRMFYKPANGAAWLNVEAPAIMEEVRQFCASTNLLPGTANADDVAIEFTADGATSVMGTPSKVKLRFTDVWMDKAAELLP